MTDDISAAMAAQRDVIRMTLRLLNNEGYRDRQLTELTERRDRAEAELAAFIRMVEDGPAVIDAARAELVRLEKRREREHVMPALKKIAALQAEIKRLERVVKRSKK